MATGGVAKGAQHLRHSHALGAPRASVAARSGSVDMQNGPVPAAEPPNPPQGERNGADGHFGASQVGGANGSATQVPAVVQTPPIIPHVPIGYPPMMPGMIVPMPIVPQGSGSPLPVPVLNPAVASPGVAPMPFGTMGVQSDPSVLGMPIPAAPTPAAQHGAAEVPPAQPFSMIPPGVATVPGMYPGLTVDPSSGIPQWMVPPGMTLVPTAEVMESMYGSMYSKDAAASNRQRGGRGRNAKPRDVVEHSKTNVYISGLKPSTTDDDLRELCHEYGVIVSAKAIIDREQNICKGYGFVMYETEDRAKVAVDALVRKGVQAAFAKISKPNDTQVLQNVDPTNLYLTNLPTDHDEDALHAMLSACQAGEVVSCRVLRDENGESRRVGLARMDSHEACEAIVKRLNGCILPGSVEALRVKYANGPTARKKRTSSRETLLTADDGADYFDDPQPPVVALPTPPVVAATPGMFVPPWVPPVVPESVPIVARPMQSSGVHPSAHPHSPAMPFASPVQVANVASAAWSTGGTDAFTSAAARGFSPNGKPAESPPQPGFHQPAAQHPRTSHSHGPSAQTISAADSAAAAAQAASISRAKNKFQAASTYRSPSSGYDSYMSNLQGGGNGEDPGSSQP